MNWKEHILHTGISSEYKSIPENGPWAGRLSPRSTRQSCFFTAVNPQEPSSRQRTIDWKGLDDVPRVVLYKHCNHPDNDCICSFNLRFAQHASEVLLEKQTPTLIMPEATLGELIDLRISGQPEVQNTVDEKAKRFLESSLTKRVWNYPTKSVLIADLINNYVQKKTEHVEYYSVAHNDAEIHSGTKRQPGTACSFPKLEDRSQCRRCLRYQRPGETFSGYGRM